LRLAKSDALANSPDRGGDDHAAARRVPSRGRLDAFVHVIVGERGMRHQVPTASSADGASNAGGGHFERSSRATRLASAMYVVPGLGSALATAAILLYDARRHELPMTPFGWRLLGGPYQQIGTDTLTGLGRLLGITLIVVSVLDLVAGTWLWQGRRRGAMLGVAMTPISLILGTLFVVPALWIIPPVRAILAIVGRQHLR
jgi:hypothetical protein